MAKPQGWVGRPYYDFYVDNKNGDDGNSGTSPEQAWKSLAPVNGGSFPAGTRIGLKSGCRWRETLTPPSSGTSANPILFGPY